MKNYRKIIITVTWGLVRVTAMQQLVQRRALATAEAFKESLAYCKSNRHILEGLAVSGTALYSFDIILFPH